MGWDGMGWEVEQGGLKGGEVVVKPWFVGDFPLWM